MFLMMLQVMNLCDCFQLASLPEGLFCCMGQLRELVLERCYDLASLPESITGLAKLEGLYLLQCFSLPVLPPGMAALTALRTLDLSECEAVIGSPLYMDGGLDIKGNLLCRILKQKRFLYGSLTGVPIGMHRGFDLCEICSIPLTLLRRYAIF